MLKRRKIAACALSIIMIFTMSVTSFADDLHSYAVKNVYDMLEIHYTILTELDSDTAYVYYKEVGSTDFSEEQLKSIDKFLNSGSLDVKEDTYDKLVYLQDNYSDITTDIAEEEKILIDKYIMYLGLLYYQENPSQFKYLEMNKLDKSDRIDKATGFEVQKSAASTVGELKIFSDPSIGPDSSGHDLDLGRHAWISFENTSSAYQRLGGLDYYQGTGGTVGTYGNLSETNHKGVHYNVESVKVNDHGIYKPRYSISAQITADQLSRVSKVITSNDVWTYLNNCSWFAAAVWNATGGTYISAGVIPTPKTLSDNIQKISGYKKNAAVPYCDMTYYKGKKPVEFAF
jgi:hypothetical protein